MKLKWEEAGRSSDYVSVYGDVEIEPGTNHPDFFGYRGQKDSDSQPMRWVVLKFYQGEMGESCEDILQENVPSESACRAVIMDYFLRNYDSDAD